MGVSKGGLASILMLLTISVFAQQDLVWLIGNGGDALIFDGSTNDPIVDVNGAPFKVYEAMSVVSDCEGNVVFYSDGVKVYDRNNTQMPNGGGLLGSQDNNANPAAGGSSMNGSIIVGDPGSADKYFIFSVGEITSAQNNGWRYTEVDMSLQGNPGAETNGDVTANKNVLVKQGLVTEGMAVVGNECGDSLWVVTHSFNGDTLFALPITAAGGIGTPVSSIVGPNFGSGGTAGNRDNRRGSMDFSPDGSKLAMAFLGGLGGHLFDFDFASGIFSNHFAIAQLSQGCHSVEFSFDSEKVFFGRGPFNNIGRYNITTTDYSIIGSTGGYVGDLERAPNGKIYIGKDNGSSLAVINSPDAADGVSVDFVNNALAVPGGVDLGLPQMYLKPGNKLISTDIDVPYNLTQVCDKGGSLNLTAEPSCGIWDGGAYISSTGVFDPSGLATPGTYEVSYNRGECYNNDTIDFVVEDCCPPLQVRDSVLCEGESAFSMQTMVDTGIGTWSLTSAPTGTGSAATFANDIFDASNYVANSNMVTDGNYELTYTYWNAPLAECPDSVVATIVVDSFPRDIFLGANNQLIEECGTEYTFNAKSGLTYNWAAPISSATNPQVVNADGTYLLSVNSPGENCVTTDSIEIVFDQFPTAGIDIEDTTVCGAGETTVGVNQTGLDYTWTGTGSFTPNNDSVTVSSVGTYYVEIKSSANGFCSTYDSVSIQLAPPINAEFDNIGDTLIMCPIVQDSVITVSGEYASYTWIGPGSSYNGEDSARIIMDYNDGEKLSLTILDQFGCEGSDELQLVRFCEIKDPNLPNIIIPNGNNGNTVFVPIDYPPGDEAIYNAFFPTSKMTIVNRWGLEMFVDKDYPNWNGNNKQGLECPAGVYFWVLELVDANGQEKVTNGFVQLLR